MQHENGVTAMLAKSGKPNCKDTQRSNVLKLNATTKSTCHAQCQRGTGCKIAWSDTLKGVSMGWCGGLNVCHWCLDCHGLTKEDAKLRLKGCGE